MIRLIYSQRSLGDLEGILDYIAQKNPPAAVAFAEGLIETCELLATNPELGARREDVGRGLRLISHRGYAIYYRCNKDSVRIQRVLHHSRDVRQASFD